MRLKYAGRLFMNTYMVDFHTHDLWEVVQYTEGNGFVRVQNKEYPFASGDIFVMPPNVPHMDYAEDGFKNYHYTFSDIEFNAVSLIKFSDTENGDFLRILMQLYNEYHTRRKNWERIVDSLYDVLYLYLLSFSDIETPNPHVAKAMNQIIENISNPNFKISDVYSDIYLHKDYFRSIFRTYTGCTPTEFLTQKRIDYAQQLLLAKENSKLSIKDIAWHTGFSDYYYFSRVFKKLTGISPSKWEEKYRT